MLKLHTRYHVFSPLIPAILMWPGFLFDYEITIMICCKFVSISLDFFHIL